MKTDFGPHANLCVRSAMLDYFCGVSDVLKVLPLARVQEAISALDAARVSGGRVYVIGNGGSAATASHFACDLAKGALRPGRPAFRVMALTDAAPVFSAWANDTGYENVFSQQLHGLVEAGDVLVAISGSGNSRNVLEAVQVARDAGATTIGFCGFDGGKLADTADIVIVVPNSCMEQVEDVHLMLAHVIATCLRRLHPNVLANVLAMNGAAPAAYGTERDTAFAVSAG